MFRKNDRAIRANNTILRQKLALAENKLEEALKKNKKRPRLSSNLNDRVLVLFNNLENPLGEDLEGVRDEDPDDSDMAPSQAKD